ncbi:22522_t:CDS:1, partial [Cetraspora pellucida]
EHQVATQRIEITNIMNEKIKIRTFSIDKVINYSSFKNNISEHNKRIVIEHLEIGNGIYRTIKSILNILLPI